MLKEGALMSQIRNTVQKRIVLLAANQLDHPSADKVFEATVLQCPHISKATVYRILNNLAQDSKLQRINIPGGADIYDKTLEKHYHFYCVKCGRVTDAPIEYMPSLDKDVGGCRVISHQLILKGICPECNKKGV